MGNVECVPWGLQCAPDTHRTDPDACVTDRDLFKTDVWKTHQIKYEVNRNEKATGGTQIDGQIAKGCTHAGAGNCACPHAQGGLRHW